MIFWPIRPALPIPETITLPRQAKINSTARQNSPSSRSATRAKARLSVKITCRAKRSCSKGLSVPAARQRLPCSSTRPSVSEVFGEDQANRKIVPFRAIWGNVNIITRKAPRVWDMLALDGSDLA